MKATVIQVLLLGASCCCYGQKEVLSLKPPHRAVLAAYLNKHKDCDFQPESIFTELKDMRKFMKDRMQHPYYIVGDFNHDGFTDFAMVLALRKEGSNDTERIVVWNGTNNKDL